MTDDNEQGEKTLLPAVDNLTTGQYGDGISVFAESPTDNPYVYIEFIPGDDNYKVQGGNFKTNADYEFANHALVEIAHKL